MKKKVLLLVAAMLATFFVSGEVTDTQVANYILKNKNFWSIKNQDLIYPGKSLLFNFEDDIIFVTAKKGDCLCNITKTVLIKNENSKQNVLSQDKKFKTYVVERKTPSEVIKALIKTFSVWVWFIFLFLLALFSIMAEKYEKIK